MNNKISTAQMQALIIIASLGFEILILPMVIDSLTQCVCAIVMGFVLCLFAINSSINIRENKALCFIYSVKNILVIILSVEILGNSVKTALLNNMYINQIILIVVLAAAYSAYKGIEAVARIAQMLFWFVVIGTIYVYAMTIPDINFSNIEYGFNFNALATALALGFVVNIAEIIVLLKPFVANKYKGVLTGTVFGFIMILFVVFIIMGRIGIAGIKNSPYPLFEVMYTANLPSIFIKRQEGIFISLWIISAMISVFLYFSVTVSFMERLNIDKKAAVIFMTIFVFIMSLFYGNGFNPISTYCFLQIIGGIVTILAIPVFYIFHRRKKR